MTEQTLSDKFRFDTSFADPDAEVVLNVQDVKDFIKKLKEEIIKLNYPSQIKTQMLYEIDKLAGDKLAGADLQDKKQ